MSDQATVSMDIDSIRNDAANASLVISKTATQKFEVVYDPLQRALDKQKGIVSDLTKQLAKHEELSVPIFGTKKHHQRGDDIKQQISVEKT